MLAFRGDPGVRERVDSLARREAACCPFADYRVETAGGEVIWTITSHAVELLDAFLLTSQRVPERPRPRGTGRGTAVSAASSSSGASSATQWPAPGMTTPWTSSATSRIASATWSP